MVKKKTTKIKYKQVGDTTNNIDKMLTAKKPGWRKSKRGNWYFENRKNRSDREGSKIWKGERKDIEGKRGNKQWVFLET